MEAQRKQEIRSLIHEIPVMVRAHLVNQAFETEKVIASTFEFTENFMNLMNNIPQNYIEKIQEVYSKLLYKAFQGGLENAKISEKSKSWDFDSDLDEQVRIKLPLPYTLSQHLIKDFEEEIGGYVETVPDAADIFVQFKKDLEQAYCDGVKEQLTYSQEQREEEAEKQQTAKDLEEVEEILEDQAADGNQPADEMLENTEPDDYEEEGEIVDEQEIPEDEKEAALEPEDERDQGAFLEELLEDMATDEKKSRPEVIDKPVTASKRKRALRNDPILADVSHDEIIRQLENYTKIPGDLEAEEVLRYELGLPPRPVLDNMLFKPKTDTRIKNGMPVMASKTRRPRKTRAGVVVGPYDSQALKQKILSAVKTHVLDSNQLQSVVIDPIVSDSKEMSEDQLASAIANALGIEESDNLELIKTKADMMAEKLNSNIKLPGELVFVDTDNDYLLTYAFDRDQAPELGLETGTTVEAVKSARRRDLPRSPSGVLSKLDQKQIEALSGLSKSRTMRDIKKASAKVAAYMNDVLKNIRTGRIGLAEGSSKLRANFADVIAEVFGLDGLGYYEYLQGKKK